jgi:hypothetical protein
VTDVSHEPRQPWAKPDAQLPVDRACLEYLLDEHQRLENERHEKLLETVKSLPMRFFLFGLAVAVMFWALYLLVAYLLLHGR